MSNVQIFNFEATGARLRTVVKDGEPWFVAADVCKALDIANPSQAVHGNSRDGGGLDEDERGVWDTYTPSGSQEMLVVSESGLYSLVFKSRKHEAKVFKRWVTHDVLPAIRKSGKYEVAPALAIPDFADPVAAARAWADAKEAEGIAKQQVAQLEYKVTEDQPKVQAAEQFLTVGDNVSLTEAAKHIGVAPRALSRWMEASKYIYRTARGKLVPDQEQIKRGRLVVYFTEHGYPQTLVTPKGLIWLNNLCSK